MSDILARAMRKLPRRMRAEKRNALAHIELRESDVFIVSYPRSGNTWVRFLLANLIRYDSGDPVDFHSVHQVVPDIAREAHLETLSAMPPPRLLKSHRSYDPRFKKVVYVLRDGRDVMVSYYYFLTGKGHFAGSFLDFLDKRDLKAGLWHEHVGSWLIRDHQADLLLIRYEDLHRRTESEVSRMAGFIGLSCEQARLGWAISNSSFEVMQRIESEKGRAFDADSLSPMIRVGAIGDWRNHFEAAHKDVFKRYANRALLHLGYVDSEDW